MLFTNPLNSLLEVKKMLMLKQNKVFFEKNIIVY